MDSGLYHGAHNQNIFVSQSTD
jgi:hypothetical protein